MDRSSIGEREGSKDRRFQVTNISVAFLRSQAAGELLVVTPGGGLGDEPDPPDLMRPFPADLMRVWPISTRVNKPEDDDPSILEPIELATDAA